VDVLVFNPPYVVTPEEELGSRTIAAAWAGGKDGRQVIDRFLPLVDGILTRMGVLFLVLIEENKPLEIIEEMKEWGFEGEIVNMRRAGRERLYIVKFKRKDCT
jgi:release factor glutamine methyltransferase